MMKVHLLLAAVLLGSTFARAQVVLPDREGAPGLHANVFGLGFAASPTTGIGLSFRHHRPSTMSYQLTGGIIKVDDRLSYALGAEVQFDLVRGRGSRFFVGTGAGYYYSGTSSHNDMEGPGRFGIGIGGEFAAGPGLHVSASLMFTYISDDTVLPLPEIGIYYYFY